MHAPVFSLSFAVYRWRWIHLPAAILIALLQRTPVLRILIGGELGFALPAGAVLKSAFAGATALGVVDTLAGATTFTVNPPSPINGRVGESLNIGFAYTGTPTPPASYQLRGSLPPGMTIPGIMANGVLNADVGTITGTPTAAGTYDFTIQGYNMPNATGMTNGVQQPIRIVITGAAQQAPSIRTHPLSFQARSGSTVALTVSAAGAETYQWRKDGADLAGANQDTLVLDTLAPSQAGSYTVVVGNAGGTVTSEPAAVTVAEDGSSRIFNLSVRTNLGAGGTLIVGFSAEGEKAMLVRAIGPTLGEPPFNLGGVHPDPRMDLVPLGGTAVEANDNWPDALAPVFPTLGAFPLGPGSRDAAIRRTLSGPHTAVVQGSGSGILLVETYDSGGDGRLVNVSARNHVGTGDNVLIGGFVIDGTVARTVVIRAVGPKLADFGVTGVLQDPKLEVFNSANQRIAENDQWNAALLPVVNRTGASGLPLNTGSNDSTLVLTLNPGLYSAIVSGVGDTTGEALVEVYEMP